MLLAKKSVNAGGNENFKLKYPLVRASQVALLVKNLTASAGDMRDMGLIPGGEDPLEEGVETHSNILAWRIPWTEEPGRLLCVTLLHRVPQSQK